MNKRITIILNGLLFALSVAGQVNNENINTNYLFKDPGSGGLELSTFYGEISPTTAWASLEDEFNKVFMVEFGIHLSRKFSIGLYFARSPHESKIPIPDPNTFEYDNWIDAGIKLDKLDPAATSTYVYFTNYGFNAAYMHHTEKLIFWRTGIRAGKGVIEMLEKERRLLNLYNENIFRAKALCFNPEAGIGINLRKWWRLHADFGYRIVFTKTVKSAYNSSEFNGYTAKVSMAFGNFSR